MKRVRGGHDLTGVDEPRDSAPAERPKRKHLPDPVWSERAIVCLVCSYSLEGLYAPGVCPECSAPFEARQLIVAGVPRAVGGGSPPRRILAALLLVGGIVLIYTLELQLRISWILPVAGVAGIVGGIAYLLVTSRRERRGVERFAFSPSGITRIPLRHDQGAPAEHDLAFVPWGDSDAVEIRVVSSVWRRLRIGRRNARGRVKHAIFDAGIRCPASAEPVVRSEIERYLNTPRPRPPDAA